MEGEKDIPVSTINSVADAQNGDELDLRFLGDLLKEGQKETFLPKSLYVRQEMHSVWDELLRNEANEAVNNQVLIGSPGVGKSVAFFCMLGTGVHKAAVRRSCYSIC
jgi:ATP-dependent Clp protease ATP-binding subunit ClpA